MQKYLIIDDEGSNLDRAVTLLRQHGYNVSLSESVPAEPKTRRSEAQQSLAKIPGKHESISSDLHSTLDAVLMARASDGKVLDLNHNFSELTGYGRDEMLGQSVLGLTFFLDPESWTNALEALERNGTADLETRILRRDGLVIFVLVSINCIQIDETPYHFMTIRSRSSGFPKTAEASRHCLPDLQINSSISSDEDINREDIGRLIDFEALQDLMNSFYKVTRIGIGINDVKGNVHVATGWQDICTRFHRVHPETLKNCLESDIYLSSAQKSRRSRSINAKTTCGILQPLSLWAEGILPTSSWDSSFLKTKSRIMNALGSRQRLTAST